MKISARPCSRCRSRSSFRYWAWIVTSRLVVGSSAIRMRGSQEIAMAPTMRCRMPPDIWCGNSRRRWSGAGMRTSASRLRARAHARRRPTPSCTRTGSATWSPTVKSGFSEAIGSCRIIAMRLPRMRRISVGDLASRSSPSKRSAPPTMRAAGGSSRRMDSASVVLPEPDSPTMPSVSPARSVSDTSSTARTTRVPRAVT